MLKSATEEQALHPIASIAVFLATVFLGFALIGPLVGFVVALPFYSGDFMSLVQALTSGNISEDIRVPLLIMQACATAVGLILIPLAAYRFIVKMKPLQLVGKTNFFVTAMTGVAVVLFMLPNSVVIDWNASLNFTGDFWVWAREKEELAERFTKFIVAFSSVGEFLVGVLVIAVLPAIGEEFTFRGWLQPALQKVTGNAHVAIWVTACLFSAFHFQFFGFLPRMLLGGLFGYLMYWSKNLWVPIIAHFVNNAFSVLMLYLHQTGSIQFDAESTEAQPLRLVIPATIAFAVLIVYLQRQITLRDQAA